MSGLFFSILIPAYNEGRNIGRCIASIMGNTDAGYEIILADDGSTDDTVEKATALGVRVVKGDQGKRKSISSLRNRAAEASSGEILLFLDADMAVPPDCLARARSHYERGFSGALGFVDTVPEEAGWVGRYWSNAYRLASMKTKEVDFLTTRNFFIPGSLFAAVHGFDEELITCEDKELSFRIRRAGFPLLYSSEITLLHYGYERNIGEFIRKEYWRQGYTLMLARKCGFSLRSLRNPLLCLWHLLLPALMAAAGLMGLPSLVLALCCLWLAPSLAVSVKNAGFGSFSFIPVFVLTFLRWNVAGIALVKQILWRLW